MDERIREAERHADEAAGWLQNNWEAWLGAGLRILLILVIALVLRAVVRRTITRLVDRMNRSREDGDAAGGGLGSLLINAERRRQRSAAIGSVLRSVASFLILGTAALTVLSVFDINLGPLLASAGVAGVAIGFGARNLVTDVLTGMFILLEDQYGVGDRVDAGEAVGTVLEIGLRVTKLRGDDGEIWYVRNGEIKRVGNLSQGWATATVDVQVRADEDLDTVREAITEAGRAMAGSEPWDEKLWGPVEVLGLDAVGMESMTVRVSVRTMPGEAAPAARELRWRVKRALDAQGIPLVDDEGLAQEAAAEAASRLSLRKTGV
ncbi:mechanosensitive ion channel family protein [Streptomyces sp. JJ38]|uniref:mechanosensitive ion channel family protein n=1 Tax=Streptomyces sp. JJ38 TaxID=2738128 RepID=UPI001C585CBB|nr:mechanosensitive ion channel family protein [Streptomyces sp. JJ38]MBW1598479.1 mechanosensitive ion channel family protein [Streptomyces sp. JJ38]